MHGRFGERIIHEQIRKRRYPEWVKDGDQLDRGASPTKPSSRQVAYGPHMRAADRSSVVEAGAQRRRCQRHAPDMYVPMERRGKYPRRPAFGIFPVIQ